MLFISFCKKIWYSAKLAVLNQLEYRLNFMSDALFQSVILCLIEVAMWKGFFLTSGKTEVAGYAAEKYLAYALWGPFFARVAVNWMYEGMMIREVDSGRVNSILVRPYSFYEYYLGQFMGYKIICLFVSLAAPIVFTYLFHLPVLMYRLPLAVLLILYYLILVYTISFVVAAMAFWMTRVYSITFVKNITLWLLTGELFPLDMIPEPYRAWIVRLPFSAGVYRPIGYLTGRIEVQEMYYGFFSVTVGILLAGAVAAIMWRRGLRVYTGTGA